MVRLFVTVLSVAFAMNGGDFHLCLDIYPAHILHIIMYVMLFGICYYCDEYCNVFIQLVLVTELLCGNFFRSNDSIALLLFVRHSDISSICTHLVIFYLQLSLNGKHTNRNTHMHINIQSTIFTWTKLTHNTHNWILHSNVYRFYFVYIWVQVCPLNQTRSAYIHVM